MERPRSGYALTNLFPTIVFDEPVGISHPPGETNRLFVIERKGRVLVIPDLRDPHAELFLDLHESTESVVGECGLLGLAFHPNYKENGRLFVYRTRLREGMRDELCEYRLSSANSNRADRDSEKILISQLDMGPMHNAGDLKFGPDGYLYLALGYEGPPLEDQHSSPQAIDKGFFAAIIRIDVDSRPENLKPNSHPASSLNYKVPWDNPFVGTTSFNGTPVAPEKVRTEFYAVGFRNPWRFTFDPFTGELICGDVCTGIYEEINVVAKGGNYGWPYLEGVALLQPNPPPGLRGPIYQFSHGNGIFEGRAVIGGIVYSGRKMPELGGKYLFGDYQNGHIWSLDHHTLHPSPSWLTAHGGIVCFGKDPRDDEVLVANIVSGTIEKLVYTPPAESGIPQLLSEVRAFSDVMSLTAEDSIPYQVNTPLWSDGARKLRWINMESANGKISFRSTEPYAFPAGAILIKHFELEMTNGVPESRKRIETRFLVKTTNGVYGLTYRWGDSITNAFLVPPQGMEEAFLIHDRGTTRTQLWVYPGREQCQLCHSKEGDGVLGFNTYQLNREIAVQGGTTNQLSWLAGRDLFENNFSIDAESEPRFAALDDTTAPLQHRVRSYLQSNCVQCHQPGGLSHTGWDARLSTPFHLANILNAPAVYAAPPVKIVTARDPDNSFIPFRAATKERWYRMPLIGSLIPDDQFLSITTNWIMSMPSLPWIQTNIGAWVMEGAAEQNERAFRISSSGFGLSSNSFFSLYRPVRGSVTFSAKLNSLQGNATSETGLILAADFDRWSARAYLMAKQGELVFALKQAGENEAATVGRISLQPPVSLRMIESDGRASGYYSTNGTDWTLLGEGTISLPRHRNIGFFGAGSLPSSKFCSAYYDGWSLASIDIKSSFPEQINLPASIALDAEYLLDPPGTSTIQYLSNGRAISDPQESSSFLWTNPTAGLNKIQAVLKSSSFSFASASAFVDLQSPPSRFWINTIDHATLGLWTAIYGQAGFLIPGYLTNVSPKISQTILKGQSKAIVFLEDSSALVTPEGKVASMVQGAPDIALRIQSKDYRVHKAALYFVDWLANGAQQTVKFTTGTSNSETEISAKNGTYLTLAFVGSIDIQILNPNGIAYLNGIFFDDLKDVSVSLIKPADKSIFQQPASMEINASASAPDRSISRVECWDGDQLLGASTGSEVSVLVTNLLTGTHSIRAVAIDAYGNSYSSPDANVEINPPPGEAHYVGSDRSSGGNWRGRYGTDGFWTFGQAKELPLFLSVMPQNEILFYAGATTNESVLEGESAESRIAAFLLNPSEFSLNCRVLDGGSTKVGLYLLDWGNSHLITRLRMLDSDGRILDEREVRDFSEGVYEWWEIKGDVTMEIKGLAGNAAACGLFVDTALDRYRLWKYNQFSRSLLDQLGEAFDSTDADNDGVNNMTEFLLGCDPNSAGSVPFTEFSVVGGQFLFRAVQNAAAAEINLALEGSIDLKTWTPRTGLQVTPLPSGDREIKFTRPFISTSERFYRLRMAP